MWHHLKFLPFIGGVVIGAIIFLGFKPDSKERVVKWPNPENAGKIVYRDRNGLCYKFESQIVDCSKVAGKLQAYSLE
jgi:hypothetical protein